MPPSVGWLAEGTGGGGNLQVCYDTLLHGDDKGNLYPWLAESYKVADDLKSITFTLRKGVKFHDGSDLNAEVAKWNLDNYITARMEPYWASVDIIDDYTVRVNFTQWMNTLPASFAFTPPLLCMVSKAAFEKNGKGWMRQNPVGTGPFKFVSYQQDVSSKYVRNPDYWVKDAQGNQLPYLDGLEFIYCADRMAAKMLIESGEGDMVDAFPGKETADYAALGLTVKIEINANGVLVPDSAHADSPWANKKVREAVEYAIDREAIVKAFGYGYWQAPYQIPTRSSLAYDSDFPLARKYNPEKAKQLLTEAGYPDGFKTTIIVCPIGLSRDAIVAVQANLAEVGIQAELDFPEIGKWVIYMGPAGAWHNAAIIMPFSAQDPTFIEALRFMDFLWGQNWLRTPEVTQAYEAALASPTLDFKLARAVTDLMTQDALFIPVYEIGAGRADRPYVVADPGQEGLPPFESYEDWWLNK
jgi:ABC-type transport system substrate-binding protein